MGFHSQRRGPFSRNTVNRPPQRRQRPQPRGPSDAYYTLFSIAARSLLNHRGIAGWVFRPADASQGRHRPGS